MGILPNWFIRRFNKNRDRQYVRNIKILLLLITVLTAAAVAGWREERIPLGRHRDTTPLTEVQVDRLALWWFAPFFSGGGYSSEAISFVEGLAQVTPALRISQHGDATSWEFVEGLPPDTQDLLQDLATRHVAREHTIVLCHSEPGAWTPALFETPPCPVGGAQYFIGRTMFETDRLPKGWAERCNEIMDEVWVPTWFHYHTFKDSGVDPSRLVVVPEPIDTAFWDPRRTKKAMKLPHRTRDRRGTGTGGRAPSGPGLGAGQAGPKCFAFLSVFKWEARKGW
eukprot:EG_transcript_22532